MYAGEDLPGGFTGNASTGQRDADAIGVDRLYLILRLARAIVVAGADTEHSLVVESSPATT